MTTGDLWVCALVSLAGLVLIAAGVRASHRDNSAWWHFAAVGVGAMLIYGAAFVWWQLDRSTRYYAQCDAVLRTATTAHDTTMLRGACALGARDLVLKRSATP